MRILTVCIYCLNVDYFGSGLFVKPTKEVAHAVAFARKFQDEKIAKTSIRAIESECEDCKKDVNKVKQPLIVKLEP